MTLIIIAVPVDPPMNLRVSAVNATSVHLTWSPPLYPYGNIVSYTILVEEGEVGGNLTTILVNASLGTSDTVTDLLPFTHYNFSVAASTRVGTGPYDIISTTTPQASKSQKHAPIYFSSDCTGNHVHCVEARVHDLKESIELPQKLVQYVFKKTVHGSCTLIC